jgi:hypothetical protein
MNRPSEAVQSILGGIIGAVLIIGGALNKGFDFNKLTDPEVQGAITLLVTQASALVTWFIARRQRLGVLGSATDGKVTK